MSATELERLRADLAASQAREKALRETLIHCSTDEGPEQEWLNQAREVLALPTDDTALRAALAQAQEEMRERCIEEVRVVGGIGAIEVERLIRALEVKP